ncbi:uncharacterized protein LOC118195570 [Stegodyphus dumicola]|uniref:uncharacterized protein LOC118195570 n=1 Tax=Stegodyphus dumicola TaxID=202533 RepID=UPI0015B33FDB|nr:uncharacterized protein LOC118195570 [Stegodyphus dumicola]
MAFVWFITVFLAAVAETVVADFNFKLCDPIKDSYGLVPPVLPKNFEMRAEHVDYNKKYVQYEELYFDDSNYRAKYMYMQKGIEHHFLFDYAVAQVVQYDVLHPGMEFKKDVLSHTCTAIDIDESEYRYVTGYVDEATKYPKMYTSNEALRFGGKYSYAFNGTYRLMDRGILVDKFIGCIYDLDMDATMSVNYTFNNDAITPSAGTPKSFVTGIDNGLLPVPVKADMYGSMYDDLSDKLVYFNKTMNYFWFQGEPEFKLDTFQIPKWMYCKDYRGRLDMPKFPNAFSTRLQVTAFEQNVDGKHTATEMTSFEEIYYYYEKKLARRDYTPDPTSEHDKEIYSQFQNYGPVKTVYDFNEGLLYVTNKASGRCYIRAISGDFFQTTQNVIYTIMGTPEEIFLMQADEMEYKGTTFVRDIECDVFAGRYFDANFNATYDKETFFSTNGWHEEADEMLEYGVPVQHTILRKQLAGELVEGVRSTNFLKFKAKAPYLRSFDVSNCIETQDHKDFAILLAVSGDVKKVIFNYKFHFLDAMQYYLTEVTKVITPLRIQRLHLRQVSLTDPRTVLLLTLVDKAKLKTNVVVGQKGANLEEAIISLYTLINRGGFALQFIHPVSKENYLVAARPRSLYVLTSTGDLKAVEKPVPDFEDTNEVDGLVQILPQISENVLQNADDGEVEEEKEEKGMTPGGLGMLAVAMLFIGVGIGVSIMYLYIRKYSANNIEDQLALANSAPEINFPLPSTSETKSIS